MKIKDLIALLNKAEDQDAEVLIFNNHEYVNPILIDGKCKKINEYYSNSHIINRFNLELKYVNKDIKLKNAKNAIYIMANPGRKQPYITAKEAEDNNVCAVCCKKISKRNLFACSYIGCMCWYQYGGKYLNNYRYPDDESDNSDEEIMIKNEIFDKK